MFKRKKFAVGKFYEDCAYHPVLCTEISEDDLSGISLIDGSSPRSCSLKHCAPRPLTFEEAIEIKENWHGQDSIDFYWNDQEESSDSKTKKDLK